MSRSVIVVALVAALSGCSSAQLIWYGCDKASFRGWDYQSQCARLQGVS